MATQTDVQQLIQGLTPSSANTGNPNTAYNNPPGGSGGMPAIPMADSYGNWFTPTISPAANYTQSPLVLPPMSGIRFPTLPTLPSGGVTGPRPTPPPGGGGPGVPAPTPTPTQPPSGGGVSRPPTGGGSNTGGWNTDWYNGPYVPPNTGGSGWTNTGVGATNPFQNIDLSKIDWNNALDGALDILGLPGDWYLSESGNWDISNAITSTLSTMTGLPIGTIASALGWYGATHGWSENNPFVNHYMDNVQNRLDGFSNQFNENVGKGITNFNRNTANQITDSWFQQNYDKANSDLNDRMQQVLEDIQKQIDASASTTTTGTGTATSNGTPTTAPVVASRPIGGNLSFSGGSGGYNNGVGAGTGFGASNYSNGPWTNPNTGELNMSSGDVAMGFGVGGMSGGARDQVMSSDGPTGRKQRI